MEFIDGDKVVWKSDNFVVVSVTKPFISREEGGHLMIKALHDKFKYDSRRDFSPSEALEVARLCQMISIAYEKAMKKQGVNIVRINYFEAGNWAWKADDTGKISGKAHYHEHIFGRVASAKNQKFPEAPYLPDRSTGFYDSFVPLTDEDIMAIRSEMEILEKKEKYKIENWTI